MTFNFSLNFKYNIYNIMNLNESFQKLYGYKPSKNFDCGGRFEILGNHTDHNHGLCLAATADLCITCALSKRIDNIINLNSEWFGEFRIDLSNLEYDESEDKSIAMIRGIANYFVKHGFKVGGFDAVFTSNIFPGAGVSSGAAYELIICQIFNELYNQNQIDKITLAKAGQYSENSYYGKASGPLDQIGVSYGNVVAIDFENIESPKVENIEFPFDDLSFVCVNTGGDHSSMNKEYSQIPIDMKSAAKKMGVNFLRESTLEKLNDTKGLTEIERLRSIHFYSENERVKKAILALKNKDKKQFLKNINESRISSTNNLKNMMFKDRYEGSPLEACDIAMSILKDDGACKINGGGFAGSIICVVPHKLIKTFLMFMSKKYGKENVVKIEIRKYGPRSF